MAYIFENLYIENFKGFRESTAIKIDSINLLTGKNNAGKSSLIELINIISSSMTDKGIRSLKFSSLDKFLSFDKALNYNSKTKEIILTFPSTLKYFGEENLFHIQFTFEKSNNNPLDGFLKSIKYLHVNEKNKSEELIFQIKIKETLREYPKEKMQGNSNPIPPNSSFFCNMPFIINHAKNNIEKAMDEMLRFHEETEYVEEEIDDKIVMVHKQSEEERLEEMELMDEFYSNLLSYNDYKISFYDDKYDNIYFSNSSTRCLKYYDYNDFVNDVIESKEESQTYSIYDYKKSYEAIAEYLDDARHEKLIDIEGNFNIGGRGHYRLDDNNKQLDIMDFIEGYWKKLNSKFEKHDFPEIDFLNMSSKTHFSELIFESIIGEFLSPLIIYNKEYQNSTIIDIGKDDVLDSLLKTLYNKNLSKESIEYSFLNFWLNEFGYGNNFKLIEENNNIIITFDNNKRIDSFGRGLQSLLKTLIAITCQADDNYKSTTLFYSESILILIEPESNLHPDLQSKLADLIVDATRKFEIKFIVESHSEYLIRKLQYWTSKGRIKPGQTILNYFDKDQEKKTIKINQITIDKYGNLSDDLGEGFIDHAPKLMLDLLNLKKKNNWN